MRFVLNVETLEQRQTPSTVTTQPLPVPSDFVLTVGQVIYYAGAAIVVGVAPSKPQ